MCEDNKCNDDAQPKQQLPEFKVSKKPEKEQKGEQEEDNKNMGQIHEVG